MIPNKSFKSVVLPAPLGPSSATNPPCATSRFTPFVVSTRRLVLWKSLPMLAAKPSGLL